MTSKEEELRKIINKLFRRCVVCTHRFRDHVYCEEQCRERYPKDYKLCRKIDRRFNK